MRRSEAMRWTASAMRRAWGSDSMTQGPAMRKSGPPPMGTSPRVKWEGWGMNLLEHKSEAPRRTGALGVEVGVGYGFASWKECGPLGTDAMHCGSDETVKGEFATPCSEPVL